MLWAQAYDMTLNNL